MNLDELKNYIQTRDLTSAARAAGHLPVYLYAYPAEREDIFTAELRGMVSNLTIAGKTVLHRDLFDLTLDLLREEGVLDQLIVVEPESEKGEVIGLIDDVANLESKLLPHLKREMDDLSASVLLLSGLGKCYPFLRAKKLVTALESGLGDKPVILFFPGSYDGWSLMLFGTLPEHSYRAINLGGQIFNH